MPLAKILADFKADIAQCDNLIANAHRIDISGNSIFPPADQKQITVAAFLNLFIAWETCLESSLAALMVGSTTLSGSVPIRYVAPVSLEAARLLVVGVQRYFDYGNHEYVRRLISMYFQNGYPYEPHLSAINSRVGRPPYYEERFSTYYFDNADCPGEFSTSPFLATVSQYRLVSALNDN